MSKDTMRTAGKGEDGQMWHTTTVDKWVVTTAPFRDGDRHIMKVGNREDALAIGALLGKHNHTIFLTHIVEEHFHIVEKYGSGNGE